MKFVGGGARAGFGSAPRAVLLGGLGSAATITVLLRLQSASQLQWLIPSFGASCALVFGVPDSPIARPVSVIGGHLVSTLVGLVVMAVLGHGPLAMAVGVSCAIAAMMVTRTMHPPVGGAPLIVIATAAVPTFLLTPVLVGTIAISLAGFAFRQLRLRRPANQS